VQLAATFLWRRGSQFNNLCACFLGSRALLRRCDSATRCQSPRDRDRREPDRERPARAQAPLARRRSARGKRRPQTGRAFGQTRAPVVRWRERARDTLWLPAGARRWRRVKARSLLARFLAPPSAPIKIGRIGGWLVGRQRPAIRAELARLCQLGSTGDKGDCEEENNGTRLAAWWRCFAGGRKGSAEEIWSLLMRRRDPRRRRGRQ